MKYLISVIWSSILYLDSKMIKINNKEFEYVEGMTVSEAYRLACGASKLEHIASLNGTLILHSLWSETLVPDGAELDFIPIASGG